MEYTKILVICFTLILLSSCNGDEISENIPIVDGSTGIISTPLTDDEIIEELDVSEVVTSVVIDNSRIILIDVATGESLANHELDEHSVIDQVWDLGEGYYIVWGGEPSFDAEGFVDNDFKLMIFDEGLNLLEALMYDEEEFPQLFSSVLRLVDGELFVYGLEAGADWGSMTDFLRINVHTQEVERLFEVKSSFEFYDFINDHQILIFERLVDWNEGSVNTNYGLLDIETGYTQLSERQGFAQGQISFHASKVLITESHVTDVVKNEIIIFNLDDLSSIFVQLEHEESMWAHFSYNGDYIVTINEEKSVFRKYGLDGEMIAEVDIELPTIVTGVDEIPGEELYYHHIYYDFEIFPITEQIYALHIHISFSDIGLLLRDRHIQIITLP